MPVRGGRGDQPHRSARLTAPFGAAGFGARAPGRKLPGTRPRAYAVFVDDRDIVWVSDFAANAIVRFDPATETFTAFPSDREDANVRQMLGRPGEMWGAESGTDRLVVVRTR